MIVKVIVFSCLLVFFSTIALAYSITVLENIMKKFMESDE